MASPQETWPGAAADLSGLIVRDGVFISEGPVQRVVALSLAIPPTMARSTMWKVEDFELHKELYRGKTSLLYMATDKRSGIQVALKLYRKRKLSQLNRYQVEREIRIHIKLDHENIVKLWAAFEDEKNVYLVQEFAGGGDLFEDMKKAGGQMKEKQAVREVLFPFLSALGYLHGMGIIHRDIKPENILLTSSRVIKVADFGLSIDVNQERPVTRAGTLDYMAPEVLICPDKRRPEENKEKALLAYSAQVDAWAVGILAYELMVGYPPFEQESRAATYEYIMYKEPKFPAWMTEDAKKFITVALCKNATQRLNVADLARQPWVGMHLGKGSAQLIEMAFPSALPSRKPATSPHAVPPHAAATAQLRPPSATTVSGGGVSSGSSRAAAGSGSAPRDEPAAQQILALPHSPAVPPAARLSISVPATAASPPSQSPLGTSRPSIHSPFATTGPSSAGSEKNSPLPQQVRPGLGQSHSLRHPLPISPPFGTEPLQGSLPQDLQHQNSSLSEPAIRALEPLISQSLRFIPPPLSLDPDSYTHDFAEQHHLQLGSARGEALEATGTSYHPAAGDGNTSPLASSTAVQRSRSMSKHRLGVPLSSPGGTSSPPGTSGHSFISGPLSPLSPSGSSSSLPPMRTSGMVSRTSQPGLDSVLPNTSPQSIYIKPMGGVLSDDCVPLPRSSSYSAQGMPARMQSFSRLHSPASIIRLATPLPERDSTAAGGPLSMTGGSSTSAEGSYDDSDAAGGAGHTSVGGPHAPLSPTNTGASGTNTGTSKYARLFAKMWGGKEAMPEGSLAGGVVGSKSMSVRSGRLEPEGLKISASGASFRDRKDASWREEGCLPMPSPTSAASLSGRSSGLTSAGGARNGLMASSHQASQTPGLAAALSFNRSGSVGGHAGQHGSGPPSSTGLTSLHTSFGDDGPSGLADLFVGSRIASESMARPLHTRTLSTMATMNPTNQKKLAGGVIVAKVQDYVQHSHQAPHHIKAGYQDELLGPGE